MIYLTLDTDVWISLLKEGDEETQFNKFDELIFWIEQGHIKYVLPENIKTEWERNKENQVRQVRQTLTQLHSVTRDWFKTSTTITTALQPNIFEEFVRGRINKIDNIFASCEIAKVTESILIQAGRRNLNCIAPNHHQDSFRDTVNILSLLEHIKGHKYKECIFASLNSKDYSDPKNNQVLHDQLKEEFKDANLTYFHGFEKLIGSVLRTRLPSYLDHLKALRQKEAQEALNTKAHNDPFQHENLDAEFLDNIVYIDRVIEKKRPTSFEKDFILKLIESHPSYQNYFFKKVGSNDLV